MKTSGFNTPAPAAPRTRLAVVVSHPIQYYSPWFRDIARRGEWDLRVFYLSDHGARPKRDEQFGKAFAWDVDLLSGHDHEFVPNLARRPDVTRFDGLRNPGLRPALRAFRPDAVLVFGYAYRPHLALALRGAPGRAPLIFRGDSHLLGRPRPSLTKRLLLRLVYSRFAAVLPVGRANDDYFAFFGVPPERRFLAPHSVDSAHFRATPERETEAAATRAGLGIPATAPVALFAGKFIPVKAPELLLRAFARISDSVPEAHLVLAGDGELLPALRAAAGSRPRIHFLPFANQSAMPARYLAGDVLVLPSHSETWGLAVNEAMHLGRPCVVSDHVGCHPDLVLPGRTGWTFPAGDESALAATLRDALSRPRAGLAALGAAAAEHVSNYNYAAATAGLRRAIDHALAR